MIVNIQMQKKPSVNRQLLEFNIMKLAFGMVVSTLLDARAKPSRTHRHCLVIAKPSGTQQLIRGQLGG